MMKVAKSVIKETKNGASLLKNVSENNVFCKK